jgi:hypothetical protein
MEKVGVSMVAYNLCTEKVGESTVCWATWCMEKVGVSMLAYLVNRKCGRVYDGLYLVKK